MKTYKVLLVGVVKEEFVKAEHVTVGPSGSLEFWNSVQCAPGEVPRPELVALIAHGRWVCVEPKAPA